MHPLNTQRYVDLATIVRSSLRTIAKSISFQNEFIQLTQESNCQDANNRKVIIAKKAISHFYRCTPGTTIIHFTSGKHLFFHETPDQIEKLLQS